MDAMAKSNAPHSHLFTVRVWPEKLSADVVEIRFEVRHILTGETRIFREGEPLLAYLLAKLATVEDPGKPTD
jgi:hypothetical protein